MTALTYFTVTGTYLAALKDSAYDVDNDPDLTPMSGHVTFTPLIDTGDSIPATTLTPPANLWLVPVKAQIRAGVITCNGVVGVKLVANTAVLGLSGDLYYRVDYYDGLTAGGKTYQPNSFSFLAPTTATTVDVVSVTPLPGSPAVGDVLPVLSVAGKAGAVVLVADDISNATTVGKSVMTATDAAAARGALGISGSGAAFYANLAAFPGTGDATKEYIAIDTGKLYRWDAGTVAYIELSGVGPSVDVATHAATGKATPVGADEIPVADSAASFGLKKATLDSLPVSTAQAAAIATKKPIESGTFPWPQGLVALWDFQQDTAGGSTVTSRVGSQVSTLTALASKTVVKDAADPGPFGPSLVLDGATVFVKSGSLGALDASVTGDEVTMVVWVKDSANNHDDTYTGIACRGGSHCEPGDTPARQFADYFDANYATWSCARLAPHIGAQDGATPGYPYNVDMASTARKMFTGTGQSQWHMEAFTFNGAELTAYIDGLTDILSNVTETPPSPGSGYTQSRVVNRNPYPLRKGINRSQTTKRFTIGASCASTAGVVSGINFTTGKLGGVAVFNRALSAAEVMRIRLGTLLSGEAITSFGFEVSSIGPHALNEIGWSAGAGATNSHVGSLIDADFRVSRPSGGSKAYLRKTSTAIGAAWESVSGLNSAQLARIRFKMLSAATTSAAVRPMVKVGSQWWASNTTYSTSSTHASDTDWTGAETKTLAVDWGVGNWKAVTIADTGSTATVQNLAKNPALTSNATNWFKASGSAPNATGARVSDGAGGFVFRYTWTGTDGGTVVIGGLNYTGVSAITAGNLYSASAVLTPSKPQKMNLQFVWVDSGNAQFATTDGGTIAAGAGNATTLTVSATAPAGAVAVIIRVQSTGTAWFSGDTLDMTKVMVVNSLLPLSYFDGTTTGAVWDGTAGNSSSTFTNAVVGVLSLAGSTNTAWVDNALLTAVGFMSSGGDGSVVRVTDLELLPN